MWGESSYEWLIYPFSLFARLHLVFMSVKRARAHQHTHMHGIMHTFPAQMEQRPKKSAMTSLQAYQLIDLSAGYEWLTVCARLSVFVCAGGSVRLIQVTCVNDVHDLTSAAKTHTHYHL